MSQMGPDGRQREDFERKSLRTEPGGFDKFRSEKDVVN